MSLSVVIPTHQAASRIRRLLISFAEQSIDPRQWEAIFVVNGIDDGTLKILESWRHKTGLNARVISTPESGAGLARNLGLANSRGKFITFVDDDDWLETRFLEVGLASCSEDTISLLPIKDEVDGSTDDCNSLNARRELLAGSTVPLASAPWILGFNACKFVPAALLKQWRYNETLSSGEDVAYFGNLLRYPGLKVAIPRGVDNASYIRTVRNQSVSRPAQGFQFNVSQRLDVIAALQQIDVGAAAEQARKGLECSQFKFVERWLQDHPEDFADAADYALSRGVTGLEWNKAQPQCPKRLVFSYCFPPFGDPAANVVAKRIARRREVVDVVSADMSAVREVDPSTEALVAPWVRNNRVIGGYPSFSSWPSIARFGRKASRSTVTAYDEIYSRALWSGSHVAGALYKINHPSVKWEAEFSDPLRWDAAGEPRLGGPATGRVAQRLRKSVEAAGWESELAPAVTDHFALTELATLVLADEVTFSNENQQLVILESYGRAFCEHLLTKARISPQPEPPASAYFASRRNLALDPTRVNLGYFGNFYLNRGLGDFADALELLPAAEAERFVLHVFSSGALDDRADEMAARGNLVFHSSLSYLDFLGVCRQFDTLIVVDTTTAGSRYSNNPFLPSKVADYAGSGTPIWAMVEPGSPLSHLPLTFVSELGNSNQAVTQLIRIAASRE